jgi:hypothetical protein
VIKAGNPGLKRNLAFATAVNAQLAIDRADTRVVAAAAPELHGLGPGDAVSACR